MEYEAFFMIGAALLLVFDLFVLATVKRNRKHRAQYGFVAAVASFVLILTCYLILLGAFVNNDFSLVEVYSYSSSGLSLLSKIYASWGGARGSMLFLTFILSMFYFALRVLTFRRGESFNFAASKVMGIVVIVFIAVCLLKDPFERLPVAAVEGKGLNPQLQTLWMAIHPPIVFTAYAFVVLAYAFTLASMETGRELDEGRIFKFSTYMGWLLLTLGIGLGGAWAYEVLGWGGYWAWDPVETASLLPWLFLTAYFHLNLLSKNRKSLTREFMILVTFASLVFLSALTRGGFTQSVHSYAVSLIGPVMLVFALGMVSYFFYLRRRRRLPLFKLEVDRSTLSSKSSFVGFWALIFIALVCLVGLAFPNFSYNYWTFPFVIVFIVALIGCSLGEKTRLARLFLVATFFFGFGIFLVLLNVLAINILAVLSLPLLILAFATAFRKLIQVIRQRSARLLGRTILHFGIIVLLIGVFISAGAKDTSTITDVKFNEQVEALQTKLQITNFTANNSMSTVYNEQLDAIVPEYSYVKFDIIAQYLGKTYQGSLWAGFYPNYGLVLRPLIITTETGDIYMHLEYTNSLYDVLVQTLAGNATIPENIAVTVQTSPLVYLVWAGIALMVIGISFQTVANSIPKTGKPSNKKLSINPR
jgi:cytochrome c-type biogenesis protein CcmF